MRKKTPTTFFVLCLVFAVLTLTAGLYVLFTSESYVKCNKFIMGDVMEEKSNVQKSDYEQLLSELNAKYFEKVCDIFDTAKNELMLKLKDLLGEDYTALNDEIKALKSKASKIRESFDNEPYTAELREKLEVAKLEFVEAKTEEGRIEKKQVLNSVLSEVAGRNLKIFSEMADIRKQIDVKCVAAMNIVKQKESDFKSLEKEIIDTARKKTQELAVSYGSEVSALSFAFDVKEYSEKMSFLASFDPNMRLIDFDKNTFLEAFRQKEQNCGPKCTGDCLSCHGGIKTDSSKNYFKSETKDEFKN